MKIVTIVGARPQFIKAAAVSRIIVEKYSDKIEEIIIHTGQHYDPNMSEIFFKELNIPEPKYNLAISGGSHGVMTGRMLEAVESVLLKEKPNFVIIYGDTNSTLAGAIASSKLHIPIVHIEAGLRSFNMNMPEEINRILSDRISTLLLCPTDIAVDNLVNEGFKEGVYNVGDVMYDAALFMRERSSSSEILETLDLKKGEYVLSTIHRAENTDNRLRLINILSGLNKVSQSVPVVLPMHPRTKTVIESLDLSYLLDGITLIEPVSFMDMCQLESNAIAIATDSGGVQKEAFFYKVPCITLRDETEWVETIESGWNRLAPPETTDIAHTILSAFKKIPQVHPQCYGDGNAADAIIKLIASTER